MANDKKDDPNACFFRWIEYGVLTRKVYWAVSCIILLGGGRLMAEILIRLPAWQVNQRADGHLKLLAFLLAPHGAGEPPSS